MNGTEFDFSGIGSELRGPVDQWLARSAETTAIRAALDAHPQLRESLPRVLACSPYVGEILARYPDMLGELADSGRLQRPLADNEIDDLMAAALPPDLSETGFAKQLRLIRHRELVRIAWRDLALIAPVEEVLAELSALADGAIRVTQGWAESTLATRYGSPRTEDGAPSVFVVLGMGKLGGRELNFSSDVDLVFLYSEHGETDGARSVSNEEYFRLLGQSMVGMLSKNTSDGFVYRVDMRLRPFGDSGPLAVSASSLESYLAQHGRDWERYAYVKARIINDWDGADDFHDEVLRPFVYRRYIDYGVFSSLRDMKALIEAEARRKDYSGNIKLGQGGIREIEFIVQSLQLIRGGLTSELQERGLPSALAKLARMACLPAEVADALRDAYLFLRRLENRLQMINDRQTHDLPASESNRARLALAMGYADWPALGADVEAQRHIVSEHFRNIVFRGMDETVSADMNVDPIRSWIGGAPDEELQDVLSELGYPDVPAVLKMLNTFRDSGFYLKLDEPGRQRLIDLIPAVVAGAASQTEPVVALGGVLEIIESIGRRSVYFSLLNENPDALKRLIQLCAMGGFLVRQVAAHPMLLDELLDHRIFRKEPTQEDLQTDIDNRVTATPADDPEKRRDAIRNFQQAATFRVAVADLSGSLPLMKVSDRLTDIAEMVLQAALDLSWSEVTPQYGVPQCRENGKVREVNFAVVAYGKFGGLELGYGSDLDLIFLNDSAGEAQETNGGKTLENSVFFVRLTRRIIDILSMPTSSGHLYEVDTRLRPSGKSGLLVSSLSAFERYQREDAWTWEHQALLRGRVVAGNDAIRSEFAELRKRVLTELVNRETLQADVTDMRERMRGELDKSTEEMFDLKQGKGGVTDIEFMVQYLVLREAQKQPALVYWSDNIRQLESLAEHGILEPAVTDALADAYRAYRQQMHHFALAGKPALAIRSEVAELSSRVTGIWEQVFE
jgi:glutamate-ammonia-ligase adenylyltransferase